MIAYPTEAVYGLGCDPLDRDAVYRILSLKARPVEKGLILIASSISQIEPFIQPLDSEVRKTLERSWPGAVTYLLPAAEWVPAWLRGKHQTIALRVSDHPVVRSLCDSFGGAIVSTSANPAEAPPARSAIQVKRYFGNDLPVVPGALGGLASATPIIDPFSGKQFRA